MLLIPIVEEAARVCLAGAGERPGASSRAG
jgi:hypothetical protein